MKTDRLLGLVSQSIRRNKRDFIFSSIGIIIGIGTLMFFTALGSGIKSAVLEKVFVIQQLEVVKPNYNVGGFGADLFDSKKLDDNTVKRLSQVDGVRAVFPKMKLTFPASARGGKQMIGKDIFAELIADGIPPSLVSEQLESKLEFKDFEAVRSCSGGCGEDQVCDKDLCVPKSCKSDDDCNELGYCHDDEKICLMPIPAIINPALLEVYNGSIHTALGGAKGGMSKMPKLTAKALVGMQFDGIFGRSYLGKSAKGDAMTRRMQLVGFNDKAIGLGATIPIGYVQRLNGKLRGEDASKNYHSIVVETESNDMVPFVAREITEEMGFALSDKYDQAQRAGLLILLMTLVFNLISLIILAIAAVNIMHTFLMMILERRRELALLRALGGTRSNVRSLVLAEATMLGLVGGLIGASLGFGMTLVVDGLFNHYVTDFPFKPESLFAFAPWMFALAIGVSVVFCWMGALLPAIRAGRIDPARALSGF